MSEPAEELLNVYDARGALVGALPRAEAKRSGLAVGAVNVLLVNAASRVLLQRRCEDKENGGCWDKSVGGHVSAGESFDQAAVREAGEELFGDGGSTSVRLYPSEQGLRAAVGGIELFRTAAFFPSSRQLSIRDVRRAPDGGVRNVIYHVAVYLGRTDVPRAGFRPPADEIAELDYVAVPELDRRLLAGELAPNMAFLWLTHAPALLALLDP